MFLGVIDFGYNDFYPLGFIGYIVIIIYFIFIIHCRKKGIASFDYSIFILIFYLCFVICLTISAKSSITFFNQFWLFPFVICIILDAVSYLFKKK